MLPRYIGDVEPSLARIPMPDEPQEPIWITVHRDVKSARRVRTVLDFLNDQLKRDAGLLSGA